VSETNQSATTVIRDLRARYPETPFLALGQTVWWDEPMKAVLRVLLDEANLGGHMVLGVHDTDYFAKAHMQLPAGERYALLPHNDGSTRDLWSAAGEISQLLGSECFPTRHAFTRHGVPFHLLAATKGQARQAFINAVTEAWGWRGLVFADSGDTVVSELKLEDVAAGIRRMLEWAFDATAAAIEDPDIAESARKIARDLVSRCCESCRANPSATLTHLYQRMLPYLFSMMLQRKIENVTVTSTSELLRFGPDTADLPRFAFVDLFLRPTTRHQALDAYNNAVAGSEMYTLDRFGLGALPFDAVVPGRGRGTLRITLRAVHIESHDPIRVRLERPIECVQDLADVLDRALGPGVVLVGKAVALISMLAREFIFVFNETGSGYVHRTRVMNRELAEQGIGQVVHPILRLHYQTWDSAADVATVIRLPEPFRAAFGTQSLPLKTLSARWRQVIADQERLLTRISLMRSPRALLDFLDGYEPGRWERDRIAYDGLTHELIELRRAVEPIARQIADLYRELAEVRTAIVTREKEKGDHFRSVRDWDSGQLAIRDAFTAEIRALHTRRRTIIASLRHLRARLLSFERSEHAAMVRSRLAEIRLRAEEARLRLVREALLVIEGLPHTDHRPSAWWLPMVDPSGRWFRKIVETTRAYIEPLG
jgi:hypothetical protein